MLYARRALAMFAPLAFLACGDSVTGPGDDSQQVADPRADLEVVTVTVGDDPDPDGYVFKIGDRRPDRLEPNGVAFIPDLTPGFHWIELEDIDKNCELVDSSNPKAVELMYGERSRITYRFSCERYGGALELK
jgi:hypothetical protein